MKKFFGVLVLMVLVGGLTGCGGNAVALPEVEEETIEAEVEPTPTPTPTPAPTPAPEEEPDDADDLGTESPIVPVALVPSGRVPQDLTLAGLLGDGEIVFYEMPDIAYTTPAAENGLGNTFMHVIGTVYDISVIENLNVVHIQTDEGAISLIFEPGLNDNLAQISASAILDWDSLAIGQEYEFFFLYQGFSTVLEMAAGLIVGFTEIIDESAPVLAAEPTPEPTPTPTPTPSGVNRATYNLIRNGMTRDEVQDIIGVRHSSETTSSVAGITTTMVMWSTSNFMTSITVFFTNGVVTQTVFTQL